MPPNCQILCKADGKTVEDKIMSGILYPDDLTKRDPSTVSKELVLKCMRLWGELWETNNAKMVMVGARIDGVWAP